MLDLVTWVKQIFGSSHISFSFLGMWSFMHLWYVLKMAVRAKGNYLSGKLQSCAGLGQFSGMEDGDRGDCLFVKRGYYLCQAPFWNPRLLNHWWRCKSKSVFLVNLNPTKNSNNKQPAQRANIFWIRYLFKRQRWTSNRLFVWSKSTFRCSVHKAFKSGHVQINMENGLKFKITHRWWGLMCVVPHALGAHVLTAGI